VQIPKLNPKKTWTSIGAIAMTASLLTACGGGSSDVAGGSSQSNATTTLNLVAYSVPKPGWDKVIPGFTASADGKGLAVASSYGASGAQAQKVIDGVDADIVNLSLEPDITKLVKANKVSKDWNADATKGIPFGSVVVLVVKKGNPKGIKDWDDLLQPGLQVVTPSPLSSGAAKWNLLAPYAAKSNGGKDSQAGLDFLGKLLTKDHIKANPTSGQEATDTFLNGSGDVLISYENDAINIERQGKDVEHIIPPQTFKIENPVAVVSTSPHLQQATALKNFLFTPDGQKLWAEAGFRPVDPKVAADYAKDFPTPQKLWTIGDLGGWSAVDPALFDKDNGSITKIYKAATG
jgi:sulfate/thiosulfate-binding protein